MFPDTDEANKDRNSAEMLQAAAEHVAQAGYAISNIDTIIFAQSPKLTDFKLPIRESLAKILGVEVGQVSVKAKTGEKVGVVGRKEAIQAQCIALLERKQVQSAPVEIDQRGSIDFIDFG